MKLSNAPLVVVIDDNEQLLTLVTDALNSSGYEAIGLKGISDVSTLIALKPSMVLLDLEMPLLSGEEVLALMKELPELAEIPVIIISALKQLTSKAVLDMADDVLEKPFSYEDLLNKTRQLLN
jgi:DNA-binding response OmpR family regulator